MSGMSPAHSHSNRAYIVNIIWSWLSVALVLLCGVIFVPILIRRLGDTTYGIWVVATSLIENLWMIDLGLRPATAKFTAEFRARGEFDQLNCMLNTALAYSVLAGSILLTVAWFAAGALAKVEGITDPSFPFLIRAVGVSWAFGLSFNMFAAVLEGFNRFDLSNRSTLVTTFLRTGLSVAFVLQGYGLREMGMALMLSQAVGYAMIYVYCLRVWPEMRLSPQHISGQMARTLFGYARQVIPGIVGGRFSQGMLPSVIAYFTSTAQVTYFTQPQRLMEYASEIISRVGLVTTPRATGMHARGERAEIVRLARTANRYSVTLWGLFGCFLFVYGADFCRLWVDREFGDRVAPLLPLFVIGYTFWMGQFISAAVLMGVAHYTRYSVALLVEAVAAVAAMAVLLPLFGLPAGVAAVASLIAINRCGVLSYFFCAHFEISQSAYLARIFGGPLVLIAGSIGAMLWWRQWFGPADAWIRLVLSGAVFAVLYCLAAFRFVVSPEHRSWFRSRAGATLNRIWMRFSAGTAN